MTARGCKEISGRDRLSLLGPVFTASQLRARFDWSRDTCRVALHRWHHRNGLVRPLGGRSEVYFNLRVDPHWHAYFEWALILAIPQAITIGQSVYSNGWVSQLPNARHLAVPASAQVHRIEGCQFHVRRHEWFLAVSTGVQNVGHTIPELRPGWALADALLTKAAYHRRGASRGCTTYDRYAARSFVPDPDELYMDDSTISDTRDFMEAVEYLKEFYGFSQVSCGNSFLSLRHAYTSAHASILGAFQAP